MKLIIYYTLSFFGGFVTPALAGIGAQKALDTVRKGAPPTGGQTAPMEFFLLFAAIGVLCVILFLVYTLLYARFLIPAGRRLRHFLQTFLLYLLMCGVSWFLTVASFKWMTP